MNNITLTIDITPLKTTSKEFASDFEQEFDRNTKSIRNIRKHEK